MQHAPHLLFKEGVMIKIENHYALAEALCRKMTPPELGYVSDFKRPGYACGSRCIFLNRPL